MEGAFGGAGAHGQWWNNPNVVKQLNLTDDQRKAMDGIVQDHKMKLIDLKANLEKAEVAMGPMMKADMPDQKAIEAQIDKVVMARAELEKANARFLLDIRMQLKPDQWKQLQTLRMNRMQHQGMRGDGHDGRGGWGQGGQRPGMDGQGNQFRGRGGQGGPGGQFHRPMPGGQPPANAPQSAPAPPPAPAPGSGDTQ
jgi:Spy/CpxP family protein refolding chaperone